MGNREAPTIDTGSRVVLIALACLALLCLWPSIAAAAGETFYTSPDGVGKACTVSAPCELAEATGDAADGDTVRLAEGSYKPPFSGLRIEHSIDFGAAVGARAVIETTEVSSIHATSKADPVIHDISLEGMGGLQLESGSAQRVSVAYFGVLEDACELSKGTALFNTVCWTFEASDELEGVSDAIDISAGGENQDEPVVLRNVTAIADTEEGSGIHVLSASGAELTVNAANVIARSANGPDVFAEVAPGGNPMAEVSFLNSDYGPDFVASPPVAAVTPLGTNGNIGAAPPFLDPINGDFHVAAGSPTIDAGASDPLVGVFDLEGHDRAQSGCFGALPVPDMGAFERSPTAACPPPPPAPPKPVEPRKPIFRVVSLVLNKKLGNGRLLVETPGAGTLSLTGSGVKLVRRTSPVEGGIVSLPIQAWAITRVRLAKTGKTKVHLRVTFEGQRGGLEEWSKAVLLRKKIP
jgi:hypothetical protein